MIAKFRVLFTDSTKILRKYVFRNAETPYIYMYIYIRILMFVSVNYV